MGTWIYGYVMYGLRLHQVLGKGCFDIMEGKNVQMGWNFMDKFLEIFCIGTNELMYY